MRLSALDRKLLRDVLHLRGQVVAIGVVVTCGVATVVAMRTAYRSLSASQASYYAAYRFADVFAQLQRAPESVSREIAAIPGVGTVQTRIVMDVVLDVPGLREPASGRLIAIPERRVPILNDVYLRRGRWLEPGRRDEVIVSEAFAEANGLVPGDSVGAVINGRWERLRIAGVGLSPEFVYEMGRGSIFPDNRRFGVLWMSRAALEAAFDLKGAFNDISVTLQQGASEPEVIVRIDHVLGRYGGLGAHGRRDQTSHAFISDEIKQVRVSGTVIPAVFLGIGAFLLNIVLSRLVTTQRDQIAALKAFGYENRIIAFHYLKLAMVALFLGAAGGFMLGLWIATRLGSVYAHYYRFPAYQFSLDAGALGLAMVTVVVAALLGAMNAIARAVSLPPAQAMRPEGPVNYRPGLIERFRAARWLSLPWRIVVRNLERRPLKAGLSILGIGLAVATLLVGRFFLDAIQYIAEVQFHRAQRDDVMVVFRQPRSGRVMHELGRLPGVMRAESFRVVLSRLRSGPVERRVALMGLPPTAELRRLVDREGRVNPIPSEGVLLTAKLGETLGLHRGDTVTVDILEGSRRTYRIPVAGLVDEMIGVSAYMGAGALHRLLHEGETVSGAFLALDDVHEERLFRDLKAMPAVAGAVSRKATVASFEQTLRQSIGISMTFLIGFASAIAAAMVYNVARISLSERGRELASLRVLGFTRGEVSLMLLGEQAVLLGLAIPAGLLLGYGIAAWLAGLYQWELFRIPLVISGFTCLFAVVVVAVAGAISALAVRRRIDRLDLIEVLKTRE